jgi:signal transduction histidine kinase/HAMP domain-containing protein
LPVIREKYLRNIALIDEAGETNPPVRLAVESPVIKMERTHKNRRITLRQKAIVSVFMIHAILFSYFLYFTIVEQHHAVEEEMINAELMRARSISAAISEHLFDEDKAFLQNFVEHALGSSDVKYIMFIDREGNVLAEGGLPLDHMVQLAKGGPIVNEVGEPVGLLHTSGHDLHLGAPVAHDGKHVGEIHWVINTIEVNRLLANSTYRGIAIFIVTLVCGSLLTFFLERRMRGSLKNLIKTTRRMGQGDLAQRVEINIGDEVEELGKSVNRMAQALAVKEKELIVARNTMVSIFNGITAGIAYISRNYEIIHANHAYEVLLKDIADPSLVNGLKCFELLWQSQGVCKNCPGKSAMKTGKSKELERKIILKNGEQHVFLIQAYPVQDAGKNPAGFVEYILDITQQRKLEKELKSYTEHLEEIAQKQTRRVKEAQAQIVHQEKMAALGQMAAGVAHEIGNPLSALSSLVRVQEIDSRNDCWDGRIRAINEQVDRISRTVREMMDFSRPASYRKSFTHGNQVIQSALGISRYDRRLKDIQVVTCLKNEIPALKIDGDQLLQVFLNIILNAADAMNGDGTLTITSKLENHSVIFSFEDTGPGIPEELLSRVFEPFFTTKEVGKGTGLGLSVSYGIMQNMGGTIRASNRNGRGAVFIVEIPLPHSGERKE